MYQENILKILKKQYPDARCTLDYVKDYQLLIAVILSAQTTDAKVNQVTRILWERFPDLESLAGASQESVEQVLHPLGLYKTKAANIINAAKVLVQSFDSKVPSSRAELISIPGVGAKTANVVLGELFGIPAIAVDTHVFRLSRRIGLSSADTPSGVEQDLRELLEPSSWIEADHLLIFHGRNICHAKNPKCSLCPIYKYCHFVQNKL